MKQWWLTLEKRKKILLPVLVLTLCLLAGYIALANQPGIRLSDGFLPEKAEGVWQGKLRGQTMTMTLQGRELHLSWAGEERRFLLEGEPGRDSLLVLQADGEEVFRGSYYNDTFWDENGDFYMDFRFSYSTSNGEEYIVVNGVAKPVEETVMDLSSQDVIRLILDREQDTRGAWEAVLPAALTLVLAFVMLWWPELSFRLMQRRHQFWVYRDITDDEPSDWYYVQQKICVVILVGAAVVFLIMGLQH